MSTFMRKRKFWQRNFTHLVRLQNFLAKFPGKVSRKSFPKLKVVDNANSMELRN